MSTTLSEPVLQVLKYCLLGVLYLFLVRVLRAVWVELRSDHLDADVSSPSRANARTSTRLTARPGAGTARRTKRGPNVPDGALTMKIVEPPEHRGRTYQVDADEATVGRAAGCAVCVPDTFASQIHARIFRRDGQLFVEDLGATNGTWLNRKRVHGPLRFHAGDRLQVGNTVLELQR